MNEPVISIIVAVYNVGQYLNQCMESLVNQTYQNIEIICVNDGSTDNSLAILKRYSDQDKRIILIDQENGGVAQARNRAVHISNGQYIMYVDGDDWIELDACEQLINLMQEHQTDVIMFSYFREYGDKTLKKENIFPHDFIIFQGDDCADLHRRHFGIVGEELSHPENADAICSLCTKLFRRDLIINHDVKYIDNKVIGTNGDGLFNLFYYGHIGSALFANRHLYHYRKTNMTSHTTAYKLDFPQRWNNMFDMIQDYIDGHQCGQKCQDGLDNRIALSVIGLGLNELAKPDAGLKENCTEIKRIISTQRYRNAIRKMPIRYMPIHWKVFFLCARYRITIGVYMLLVAIKKLKSKI